MNGIQQEPKQQATAYRSTYPHGTLHLVIGALLIEQELEYEAEQIKKIGGSYLLPRRPLTTHLVPLKLKKSTVN